MIPNNNLSVLPWYTSIDQQNARKWWVYDRVYPLFTPGGYLLPFQVLRDPSRTETYTPATEQVETETVNGKQMLASGVGTVLQLVDTEATSTLASYDVSGLEAVFFENVPIGRGYYNIAFVDDDGIIIKAGDYDVGDNEFTGGMSVPEGATTLWIQQFLENYPSYTGTVYEATVHYVFAPISSFLIYKADGAYVGEFITEIQPGLSIKPLRNADCIVYTGLMPFTASFPNGQYYAVMADSHNIWYSEIFTVVNDIEPYLKIEWWDLEDFVMDAGTIVYKNPAFKNVLYLDATIAKPEYPFEEEGETRDGYFFPVKMISEKRYRFKFFASEYLLDVMRFIRMADFAQITANGQVYSLDTFLITPEWEENGDVASVEAQFDTATVAKKIGVGYIKAQRGDFNDDFNNDYNI